ncbi:hypothetical protein COLO4_05357 [Corchorus olitorius]|uniref:FAS1 domain-containing protein n=1 Tax=Corchorus olitorius TaxID=93759 RepID=A0A1R3KR80_9ROSI|nr:hypothetical protein COLO4_05357 [Corchorus olitorius]
MSSLLSKGLSLYTLKNVLALHVLVDYFGSRKLHQITNGTTLTSTVFQSTGNAPGTSGYINITDLKGGKVGFGTSDNDGKLDAVYVKSVQEIPYNISILQISQPLNSAEAEAPTAEPSKLNLTEILSKQGCKAFSDLLIATGADATFSETIDGGLTVFCPTDSVIKGFMPKYKNLTAAQKTSLMLYHGIPEYEPLQSLKSSNGIVNTLATDGANKYDFTVQNDGDDVTLKTKVNTATITGTLKDEEPLIVYKIDKVLMPRELFKAEEVAEAPKSSKSKSKSKHKEEDAYAPSPSDEDPADQAADNNGVAGLDGRRLVLAVLSMCIGVLLM